MLHRRKTRLTYARTYIQSTHALQLRPEETSREPEKHGYDFEDAPQVIESDRTVTFEDRRFAYDEQRFITLGMLREDVVVISTAETDEEIRLISMRKAERNEQEIYYSNL
jgi:uncharacterized DUF497 family protein